MSDEETLEQTQETENQDVDNTLEQDDEITAEQLEAMSDDEFEAFMNESKHKSNSKEEIDEPEETEENKETEESEEVKEEESSEEINYKDIYNQVFKPFKANGKEITPRNVDDVVKLMQMGANYTKKMQLMAPMRKAVESLNKAEIGENELNFLIDLHKGDKEAIKKFLKEHNIDPMDMDLDEESKYVPNRNNIASEDEVEFADTLLEVNDSLPKIQEIINKVWDSKSKALLLKDPNLMRGLHEEIQMGRFDEVQKRVEEEKTFGRYKGIPDIQAYIDVVTKMTQTEEKSKPIDTTVATEDENKPKVSKVRSIPDKSKAAPTKNKSKTKGSSLTPQDIFSMSEEEFNKLSINDLV